MDHPRVSELVRSGRALHMRKASHTSRKRRGLATWLGPERELWVFVFLATNFKRPPARTEEKATLEGRHAAKTKTSLCLRHRGEREQTAWAREHLESLHGSQAPQKATAFLKFPCEKGAACPRWKPGSSLRTPALEEGAWRLTPNGKQDLFSAAKRRMFLPSGLGPSFTPSLPQNPIPKAGRGRTNELLIAGEQITEAPLRLPSVQTTCSGLRDCTVVCTLVRLCWDTPHTASAARGRQHLHGRGTCLERVGCGGSCMQSSLIPQPGRITTPFETMLDHFYLPAYQPAHMLLILSPPLLHPLLSHPFFQLHALVPGMAVLTMACFTC
ncbi:uncharacterized protein LOC110407067 [Numida meleagris]|uniref:uncharacterized protein LOC110407067 n=1 Tax=Numida meleagris TaxID=8996 RepID=UPI000B3DB6A1|nr:uncharacterized protein LOC110407067 [Numida meleagris]